MSLRQVEALYKKLHVSAKKRGQSRLDPDGRSDIFDKIMSDVERLLKKIKKRYLVMILLSSYSIRYLRATKKQVCGILTRYHIAISKFSIYQKSQKLDR